MCSKVGDNGDLVFLSGTTINRVLNPVQIGSVLAKNSDIYLIIKRMYIIQIFIEIKF